VFYDFLILLALLGPLSCRPDHVPSLASPPIPKQCPTSKQSAVWRPRPAVHLTSCHPTPWIPLRSSTPLPRPWAPPTRELAPGASPTKSAAWVPPLPPRSTF
ncbi:unnamed protein product, partial [Ilex paraguariensis]